MKRWYLINNDTRPNMLSGYDDESYNDFKDDAFHETLHTSIATPVQLCNHDLSERKNIRCIIQGNSADTHLKSMERIGLFEKGIVKAGMYIFFESRYWLITGYPGTNGIYDKAVMVLCQYQLRWQDNKGKLIKRWANITSASKYDNGEYGNNVIVSKTNNFTILIPDDYDGLHLDGKRVFIDKDDENPIKVFKMTRSDEVLYDYGNEHGSVLSFIADRDEYNQDVDNQELKLCDYYDVSELTKYKSKVDCTATISGRTDLRIGYPRTYTVSFVDELGEPIEKTDYIWNVVSDFNVNQKIDSNSIELYVDDEDLIDSSFLLQVTTLDKKVIEEIQIDVLGLFGR